MPQPTPTRLLAEAGVSLWIDDLSRDLLSDGRLEDLVRRIPVSGVTTNPTIFHSAIVSGRRYDAALAELASNGATVDEAVLDLTTWDVAAACAVLNDVWRRTDGVDGRVSIEVDPRLAYDVEGTIAAAHRLVAAVGRPNVLIKIPATLEGVVAFEELVASGVSVNVTLIFSLARYRSVIAAYQRGLRRAFESGLQLTLIHSVASFFVSRVDVEIDAQLEALGRPGLKGRAAIANARLAYELHRDAFSGPEWEELAAAGAWRQRPLWASTAAKDPDYPDTLYVTELVARGVVNTMPLATLEAVLDHGVVFADTISDSLGDAREVLGGLAAAGISYDSVVDRLEREGVAKFVASWTELLADVERRLR